MCHFKSLYNNVSLTPWDYEMASTQKRIRDTLLEQVEEKKWNIKYELRIDIQDTDIINALIWKHLKSLTAQDVLEYRKNFLGKDE